jgi:D-glycero-alpha-D-manno-heptose 1-phosphate guanylyltransferase
MREIVPVILAGGFGTRLRSVLPDVPKPLAPVLGRPFVEWIVRFLAAQGFRRAILSTHHRGELIAEHFRARPVSAVDVNCVQEPRPLGTAGAFRHVVQRSRLTPAVWMVLNGDSLILEALAPAVARLDDKGTDALVVGRRVDLANRYGLLEVDERDRLTRFAEKTSQQRAGLINAGVYLVRAALAERLPATEPLSFERDVFPAWLDAGARIAVHRSAAPFLDIGTPRALARAEAFINGNREQFQ